MKRLFSIILACLLLATFALSHGGRTDKYGGHNDRKRGTYHYHNAGRVHAAANPYQDHTKCGICKPPTPQPKKK
jgi:hypothetical protein